MTRYASAVEAARAVQDSAQDIRGFRKALAERQAIYDDAKREFERLTSLENAHVAALDAEVAALSEPLRPIGLSLVADAETAWPKVDASLNAFDEPVNGAAP